jgi:hypothetical protein
MKLNFARFSVLALTVAWCSLAADATGHGSFASRSVASSYFATVLQCPSGTVDSAACGINDSNAVGYASGSNGCYALLWRFTVAETALTPGGGETEACACARDTQVGYLVNGDYSFEAVLWHDTPASMVDLNPLGALSSGAWGLSESGTYQVGRVEANFGGQITNHAFLWNGSPTSCVDLDPPGADYSVACAVTEGRGSSDGMCVVGEAEASGTNNAHATVWYPSKNRSVDLDPIWSGGWSRATTVSGPYQAGWVTVSDDIRAVLWTGSSASCVDLTPSGWSGAEVLGMNHSGRNYFEVGEAHDASWNTEHAILWTGTASSAVDLQQYLPSGYVSSCAYGVDASGNVAGAAWRNGRSVAVIWRRSGLAP